MDNSIYKQGSKILIFHYSNICKTQIFHFDRDYLLRRLDYTAEVVGRWAHAAHLCDDYQDFGGIRVPTTRRVRPLVVGNRPLSGPTLVAIDIHEFRLLENVHI